MPFPKFFLSFSLGRGEGGKKVRLIDYYSLVYINIQKNFELRIFADTMRLKIALYCPNFPIQFLSFIDHHSYLSLSNFLLQICIR